MNFRAFIATLLIASQAAAADPVPKKYLPPLPELKLEAIPAGDDVIQPLYKGQPAPYTGQLFSPETALRWANWLQQYKQQSALLLDTQGQLCNNEIDYRERVLEIEREKYNTVVTDHMQRIKLLEKKNTDLQVQLAKGPKWFESRTFGIVIGAVGALGFTMLSIWAIDAASSK